MILKAAESLGTTALILIIVWKLTDRWAGKFLEATAKFLEISTSQAKAAGEQAQAMTALATTVTNGQSDTREILLAMRVVASKVDELKQLVEHGGAQ